MICLENQNAYFSTLNDFLEFFLEFLAVSLLLLIFCSLLSCSLDFLAPQNLNEAEKFKLLKFQMQGIIYA